MEFMEEMEEEKMRNKLHKRLNAKRISFDDLSFMIKCMGTVDRMMYQDTHTIEDYVIGGFILNITTEIKNGVQTQSIVINKDVSKPITPDNSMLGKDIHGIQVTEQIKVLIEMFKLNFEEYISRWKNIEKLRDLQKQVYAIAGRT